MREHDIEQLATVVLEACRRAGIKLATAESCTGGLIAGALTGVAGSSDVVDRGFVTYSNAAKNEMLGVPMALFEAVGAVSEGVAKAMAEGALVHSDAAMAVAVTGVAGPGGGTDAKPVGLVHMAIARIGQETAHYCDVFAGDRGQVRMLTVIWALRRLLAQAPSGF